MEIILHFGAHRCATTSFQEYMRCNAQPLAAQGIAFWGPETTRETDLHGLKSMTDQSRAALQDDLEKCRAKGVRHLLISEENFLGMMQQNVNMTGLYPEARLRGQLLAAAFGDGVAKIALNIRALNTYWPSVAGFAVRNRKGFGKKIRWNRITQNPRSWRDVITDLSLAFPEIPLVALPFEEFAGHPDAQLATILDCDAPQNASNIWLSRDDQDETPGPSGAGDMQLVAKYADDLDWLAAGADGLAQLGLLPNTARGEATDAPSEFDERITQ